MAVAASGATSSACLPDPKRPGHPKRTAPRGVAPKRAIRATGAIATRIGAAVQVADPTGIAPVRAATAGAVTGDGVTAIAMSRGAKRVRAMRVSAILDAMTGRAARAGRTTGRAMRHRDATNRGASQRPRVSAASRGAPRANVATGRAVPAGAGVVGVVAEAEAIARRRSAQGHRAHPHRSRARTPLRLSLRTEPTGRIGRIGRIGQSPPERQALNPR